MSFRAASDVAKGPTTTISGSFCCRVQTTQNGPRGAAGVKTAGSSRKLSTRGRKLLTAEEPNMLRPHCEKCGCGEALRPGLDCRCHCPQCSTGKPRCSSPRMALRRGEEETCETFTSKLAMTRSRIGARRTASTMSVQKVQQSQIKATKGSQEDVTSQEIVVRKEASRPKKGVSSITCYQSQPSQCKTMEKPDSTIKSVLDKENPDVPNAVDKKESKGLKNGMSTNTYTPNRAQKSDTIDQKESHKDIPEEKQCESLKKSDMSQRLARPTCKRSRSGALKLDISSCCMTNDNLTTKYRRPHCPLCSQLGCLRNLEMICYCDACQECRSSECRSPRMADFRKSHPGHVARSRPDIKTI